MAITLEDLRGDSPAICGDFNKIREEVIRDAGEDQNEVWRMLTGIIPPKKRVVWGIIPPKKPLVLGTKNSGNINKNQVKQEKSRKTKKQRKNPTEIKQEVPDRPPCMPTEFKDKIIGLNGSEIMFVIQKDLTITDMKASQNRLLVPRDPKRDEFLRSEEQLSLEEKEADGRHFKGKKVQLIEPGLQLSTIILKKWKLGSRNYYVLSNTRMDVAKRNRLKPGNTIQLWSFRVNQELHLALI